MVNNVSVEASSTSTEEKKRTTRQTDGGLTALAGFLFQILGTIGLQAKAHLLPTEVHLWLESAAERKQSNKQTELQRLLRVIRQGRVLHEAFEQDAGVTEISPDGTETITLIQFKYSSQPLPPKLTTKELTEIVKRLAVSAGRVNGEGKIAGGYYLVTNRPLHQEASSLIQEARKERSVTGPPVREAVVGSAEHQRAILAMLHVTDDQHEQSWIDALTDFGHKHGAMDEEITTGIKELVGNLLLQTARHGEQEVTLADLTAAFTKHADAKPITATDVKPVTTRDVADYEDTLGVHGERVPRAILNKIAQEATNHALIILEGGGGRGKTVALWMWANATITSQNQEGAFTLFQFAGDLAPSWVAGAVCSWRNVPVSTDPDHGSPEKAIRRIKVANRGLADPVLHLALDGADEIAITATAQDRLKELARWCWTEERRVRGRALRPEMTLVVTCRDAQAFAQEYLRLAAHDFDDQEGGDWPCVLTVEDFTRDELLEATHHGASPVHERIAQQLSGARRTVNTTVQGVSGIQVFGRKRSSGPQVHPESIEVLQYPVIWRTFWKLDEADQHLVLNGNAEAMKKLGQGVVNRFTNRIVRRLHQQQHFRGRAHRALHLIAQHTHQRPSAVGNDYKNDWEIPAAQHLPNEINANLLYGEALSGGLIEELSNDMWRWCHPLIAAYLAANAKPQLLEKAIS